MIGTWKDPEPHPLKIEILKILFRAHYLRTGNEACCYDECFVCCSRRWNICIFGTCRKHVNWILFLKRCDEILFLKHGLFMPRWMQRWNDVVECFYDAAELIEIFIFEVRCRNILKHENSFWNCRPTSLCFVWPFLVVWLCLFSDFTFVVFSLLFGKSE